MFYRFVLVLLFMCVADREARVVNDFQTCSEFFYKGTRPLGFKHKGLKTNYEYICQQYEGHDHFATLYMPKYRIPIFSAYRLDNFDCTNTNQNSRESQWFIEPQLSNGTLGPNMSPEGRRHEDWKEFQAVNGDYPNTNYDRGHLNPSFYQCDHARTATFTLTNAVPQDPCFNRQQWWTMEKMSKQIMKERCNFPGAKRFFVTGVIPSDTFIPFPDLGNEDDYERVNVPFAMWTAACCDLSGANTVDESFSFSYYARNTPYSLVNAVPVTGLLSLLRKDGFEVQIFDNNCSPSGASSNTALYIFNNAVMKLKRHLFDSYRMSIDPKLKKRKYYKQIIY